MQTIETERLILRPWALADADDFFAYAKHPQVGLNGGWPPHTTVEESRATIEYFLTENDLWAIVLKEAGLVIGSVGLHKDPKRNTNTKELGFCLGYDYWGQGLATEASKAAIHYGFTQMDLDLISTYHKTFNARAKRVVEKCGFTPEGILRQASKRYDGQVFDAACYSILKSEWVPA